jgi:hypothetical protein
MSKPNLPGGESLEDILASIRKTLADDRADDGVARLDSLELTGPADLTAPANGGAPHDAPHNAPKGDTLPNRLADALNGASNGHAEEADLADLLETELPAPAQTPKQHANGTEARDPLWFLSRDADAQPAADAKPTPTPARERAPEPPVPAEEIALTRPETLRRSFPPLFGGGETSPARPADLPFERPKPPEPAIPTPPPVVTADKPAASAFAAAWPTAAEVDKPAAAAGSGPATTARAPFTPEPAAEVPAKTVAQDVPAPKHEPKPELKPEPKAEAKAEPVAALPDAAAETSAEPAAAGTPSPPLQEVIARLLEPVIQQWLDTNLPRMVEAAIREEVARQVKDARGDLKI